MAKARRCKFIKANTSGKYDKVKIGSRFYRGKGKALDVHPNGRVRVCPVGKSWKIVTGSGALAALHKAPKSKRRKRR